MVQPQGTTSPRCLALAGLSTAAQCTQGSFYSQQKSLGKKLSLCVEGGKEQFQLRLEKNLNLPAADSVQELGSSSLAWPCPHTQPRTPFPELICNSRKHHDFRGLAELLFRVP